MQAAEVRDVGILSMRKTQTDTSSNRDVLQMNVTGKQEAAAWMKDRICATDNVGKEDGGKKSLQQKVKILAEVR